MIDLSTVPLRSAGTQYLVWAVPDCHDFEPEYVSAKLSPRQAADRFVRHIGENDGDDEIDDLEVLVHDPESGEVFAFPVHIVPPREREVVVHSARRAGGAE